MSDLLNTARPLIEANAYANHTGVVVRDIQLLLRAPLSAKKSPSRAALCGRVRLSKKSI